MAELEHKITFDPPKFVTFKPKPEEQTRDVNITNTFNKAVMFKMKTTRPGSFKMKPVYFSLQPNQTKSIKLHYSGCPANVKPNLKDRFSVIMAIVPKDAPADWDVEKVWEDPKMQVELADSVKRKVLRIHYEGYPEPADLPEKSDKKKKNNGGSKESTDEKKFELPHAAAAPHAASTVVQPIVYIVYQGLPPREDVEVR
ncbi:hypothetical protein PFISCL1PPCAC_23385 [Pristionchus fissidentatus]|uniref:Major sperm protein n=1 Tax=Pristionchus fissidentatus TaxID=1538716 RepID=A0AAV5WKY1_9BILA|nr:hypothetical protein PFISCL1PPCAC_23385 [Pristionchus fissidentatus]